MSEILPPASLACELFKVARSEWLTRAEIADRVGVHINTVNRWVPELEAHGILQQRPRDKYRSAWLKQPAEFALAREWGGVAQ